MQGLSEFSFFLSYGNLAPVPALGRLTRKDNNNQKKKKIFPEVTDRKPIGVRDRIEYTYRGADKSLAPPGRKKAIATEGFEFHISYL
jgi:hypothetical protein